MPENKVIIGYVSVSNQLKLCAFNMFLAKKPGRCPCPQKVRWCCPLHLSLVTMSLINRLITQDQFKNRYNKRFCYNKKPRFQKHDINIINE